jgi:ferredoxin
MPIKADLLGLVFPVYAWGPPLIVKEFLKHADIRKPGYFFALATHGGGPGNTLPLVDKLLKKRGLALDAGFELQMPNNYITGSNPSSQEEARKLTETQTPKLKEICNTIVQRQSGPVHSKGAIGTTLAHPLLAFFAKQQGKKFSVSKECSHCGICEQLCPVGNIRMNAEKLPEWGKECEFCLRCINLCPVKAIESGNATKGRNRYHHPEIRMEEFFA